MASAEAALPFEDEGAAEIAHVPEKPDRYKRWLGAVALNTSIVAGTAAAYFGERYGLMAGWPHLLHEAGTSLGHPGPAFMGARLAVYLSFAKNKYAVLMTAAAGGLLTDISQEEMQSVLVDHNYDPAAPAADSVLQENFKDLGFAALGTAAALSLVTRSEARLYMVAGLSRIIPFTRKRGQIPEHYQEAA